MGLPQELVDMVVEYFRTDWDALVSCSLTCRALFCSVRRVIHERLYIPGPRTLPSIARLMKWCWIYNRTYLGVLSSADEAGLVQYTKQLTIEAGQVLTPRTLRPYLQHFRKYLWLTSLTLTCFDPTPFLPVFDRYFNHLSQSLKSLTLISPQGISDATRDFVSLFRNLDDLEFNPVPKPPCRPWGHQSSSRPRHQLTSLAGRLHIINTDSRRANSLEPLFSFPGGLHFRSLQFVCCTDINTAGILGKCSSTLESVTYTLHCRESHRYVLPMSNPSVPELDSTFLEFDFKACSNLCILEVRIDNLSLTLDNLLVWLVEVLSTIDSSVFSKFILSLDQTVLAPHVHLLEPAKTELLDRRMSLLSRRSGAHFIIKGDLPLSWRQLLMLCFPSCENTSTVRFDFKDPNAPPHSCGQTR